MRRRSPAIRKNAATNATRADMPQHLAADSKRRAFLVQGAAIAGSLAAASAARPANAAADAQSPADPPWTRTLGAPILASPYGVPSRYEAGVLRRQSPGLTRTAQSSVSFTPLQSLFGIITPIGPAFRAASPGRGDIDPSQHRLMVHGLVRSPSVYTMDDLMRLPSVSRIHFIECGANTGMEWGNVAVPTVQYTHGCCRCSEFTGVPLVDLLDEAASTGRTARFVLAEGADGASLTRTIPHRAGARRRSGRLRPERRDAAPRERLSAAPGGARRAGRVERQVAAADRSGRRAVAPRRSRCTTST